MEKIKKYDVAPAGPEDGANCWGTKWSRRSMPRRIRGVPTYVLWSYGGNYLFSIFLESLVFGRKAQKHHRRPRRRRAGEAWVRSRFADPQGVRHALSARGHVVELRCVSSCALLTRLSHIHALVGVSRR